jgi:hypothetical protein
VIELWSDGTRRSRADDEEPAPPDLRELAEEDAALLADVFWAAADEHVGDDGPLDREGFAVLTFGRRADQWLRVQLGDGAAVDTQWDGSVGAAVVTMVETARWMVEDLES